MPKPTILDELIYSCQANYDISMMKGLADLIAEQKPGAILWPQYKTGDSMRPYRQLSDKLVAAKARFFCLCTNEPILTGQELPSAGIDTQSKYKEFFVDIKWEIKGILVDMEENNSIVVTPIMRTQKIFHGDHNIFPDVPIRINYDDKQILSSEICKDHIIYGEFYKKMEEEITPEEKEAFNLRARARSVDCFGCLIKYSDFIDGIPGGMFKIIKPQAPRVKIKDNKVVKIYELGKVGYFEFVDKDGKTL